MILLALLLLAAVAFVVVAVVLDGGASVRIEAFDIGVDTTVWGVFVAGIGAGLLALAGLTALTAGVRRVRGRRKEVEQLRRKVAEQERTEPQVPPDETLDTHRADS